MLFLSHEGQIPKQNQRPARIEGATFVADAWSSRQSLRGPVITGSMHDKQLLLVPNQTGRIKGLLQRVTNRLRGDSAGGPRLGRID